MGKYSRRFEFLKGIHNRNFSKLFIKNWLILFLSMVLPLTACVLIVHHNDRESLLKQIDSIATSSTNNTASTLQTLLNEVNDTLDREISDSQIMAFFAAKSSIPPDYEFISLVNSIRSRISSDMRTNLYYSIDCYSQKSDFLISSYHQGQFYKLVNDTSITDAYLQYRTQNPQHIRFAVMRNTLDNTRTRVFTIYRTHSISSFQSSFVSISIDPNALIHFIVSDSNSESNATLILNSDNLVLLDSSGQLDGTYLELDSKDQVDSITVNNQLMRVFSVPISSFNWKCVQLIPLDEYQSSIVRLQNLLIGVMIIAFLISILLSYAVSLRLFRPIVSILDLVENPGKYGKEEIQDDELQYLLVQILELFQKNITLEQEMLDRVSTLRRLRARTLQEQMTPHFLNNVLNVICWTAIEETGNENCITGQQILLLADIIRTNKGQKNSLTTVRQEVDYIKKFVALECLRYGPDIHCEYIIAPDSETMPIPAISLQTLVENSISHGLQAKGCRGNILIQIHPNTIGGLHICVEDDGVGMSREQIDQIYATMQQEFIYKGEHLGIVNLLQRFRLLYGEKTTFLLKNKSTGGLQIEIDTPEAPADLVATIDSTHC